MDSSAKDMGYHERIEVYPDANDFQHLKKSPQASIRSFPNREEKSATTAFGEKHPEVNPWDEPIQNTQERASAMRPRRTVLGILGSWMWELLGCAVALGALAGILAVLKQFNGRALKDWPYAITINTLLSILITVTRAAVIIPLAEGISQLKWSWYRKKDQTLRDLVIFDEASRGAFGALKLVSTRSPFQLASIASILFLVSFAIGPFAQQVIEIGQRDIKTEGLATVPTCSSSYHDSDGGASPGLVDLGFSTIGAIYDGILQNSSSTLIDVTCPSGNCTFGTYQSLGFCSRCANITDKLVPHNPSTGKVISVKDCPQNEGCIYSLGLKGSTITSSLGTASSLGQDTLLNATALHDTLFHPDLANITGLVNFTVIYGETFRVSNPVNVAAYECALYFCVKQYDAKVVDGDFSEILTEKTSKLEYDGDSPWGQSNVTITPETCYKNGTAKPPPYRDEDNCTYKIYGLNGRALYQVINPLLTGYALSASTRRPTWSSDVMHRIGNDTGNRIDTIDDVFKTLAKRLTTHVRTAPNICRTTVTGTVWSSEPFILVHWLWIILPAAVVGGALLLLLVIIFTTRDEYVWKSSPLALVFLGMQDGRPSDGVTHPIFPKSPDIRSMLDCSRDIKVRLDDTGRWQLVGNR